jgi:hypothetical protein
LGRGYGPAVRQTVELINFPMAPGNCYAVTPNYPKSLRITGDFSDISLKTTGVLVIVMKFVIKSCLLAMVLKSLINLRFCGDVSEIRCGNIEILITA